jgi:ectoine hydroxylase-related dioxygenase (phytanoyl-CoA dioxygenase family)
MEGRSVRVSGGAWTSEALTSEAAAALHERGFVVLPGVVPSGGVQRLSEAYSAAVASAAPGDVRVGRTSTRVSGVLNRIPEFDAVHRCPALLQACRLVIGQPFRLSALHARTVRPRVPAQELHVDVQRESAAWPLLGFILMVDAFRPDNGATRLVPGSHRWAAAPDHADQVPACGDAGSLLVFNGSVWHGHGANLSDEPRRSVQGAFIPGDADERLRGC